MKAVRRCTFASLLCLLCLSARADQWVTPTAEELHMTAEPQAPSAPAIYLNREEITDDQLHMWKTSARIKILTEGGKDYGTVQIAQYNSRETGGYNIVGIAGRTIHPDGTIIPFTGKPYEKLLEKTHEYKAVAKVFTLPSVEVGSILEYHYELTYDDNLYIPPRWFVQSDLFTRHGHYIWLATNKELISRDERGEQTTSAIAWTPILPKNADLKQIETPGAGVGNGPQRKFELTVADVPAAPDEEFMPPIRSLGYRVLFFYTPYRTQDEFWREAPKRWAKARDKFIGPGAKVEAAVRDLVAPTDTDDQKLRKIYAAVMKLDNTTFSRQHSTAEDKSAGLGEVKTTDDVWQRKRGSDDQLTCVFVAMARAAGLKAYLMAVVSRDRSIFLQSYFSLDQLDDDIAIVKVNGAEQYFDPGQPFTPYGQLAWKHTVSQGVRQTDGGATIAGSGGLTYKDSRTDRIADLVINETGEASGTMTISYQGQPALEWRQKYLKGDRTSFDHQLQEMMERKLPTNMDVKVRSVDHLEDYEHPLVVTYDVKGPIATSAGKRILLPGDIFETNSSPTFSHTTREQAVYFPYVYMMLDAVRIRFPAGYSIESAPAAGQASYKVHHDGKDSVLAVYELKSDTTPNSVSVHRNVIMGDLLFLPDQYPDLHAFFAKFENFDHESTVLKAAPQSAAN